MNEHHIYTCRPAVIADFEKIATFPQDEEELFFMFPQAEFPLTAAQLFQAWQKRFSAMVVICQEQIVGYANFYEADYGDHCSIGNLIVHPKYRNQGVATYLIGEMERLAKGKYAAKESHLSCFEANQQGLVLYQKLGYVSYALEKREKGNGDCALLIEMKKLL